MDLSLNNVSFEGTNGRYGTENRKNYTQSSSYIRNAQHRKSVPNRKYSADGDSFEDARTRSRKKAEMRRRKDEKVKRWAAGIGAAIITAGAMTGFNVMKSHFQSPEPNFYTAGHSLGEISEFTEVSEDIIQRANDLQDVENLPEEIVVPTKYRSFDAKIQETEAKLNDKSISIQEKEDLEDEYNTLTQKQNWQDSTGEVYSDGKYAYIKVTNGIQYEDLKNAFGIKDGVIRNFDNHVDYTFSTSKAENGETVSYKDYTSSYAKSGDIIKIPLSEINQTN